MPRTTWPEVWTRPVKELRRPPAFVVNRLHADNCENKCENLLNDRELFGFPGLKTG